MCPVKMHPEFLGRNGQREFAMIPYSEFVALKEWVADMEDLLDLEEAISIEENSPGVALEDLERRFGVPSSRWRSRLAGISRFAWAL